MACLDPGPASGSQNGRFGSQKGVKAPFFQDDLYKIQPRGQHGKFGLRANVGKFGLRANIKGAKIACLGREKVKKRCFHREGGGAF